MTMSKAEKKRLMDKLGAVLAAGDMTEEQAAAQMTEIIRKSYANGLQSGIPVATVSPWVTDASIRKAADSMSSRVGSIWNSLGNELSTTITNGIKTGKSYEEVSSSVDELIRNGWGDKVEFDNRGHVIRRVRVSPDGKMEWEDHTITHKKTMTTEAYATNLSQTVVHESWGKARDDQYDDLGIEEWDYSAVGDAVTRLEHLAMHGKRIRRGSTDEVMAESLMREPNCRCKKIAVWGDPELDTDPEVWERQKIEAAKRERENVADGTPEAAYLDEIISGSKSNNGSILTDDEFEELIKKDEKNELMGKKVEYAIAYDMSGNRIFKKTSNDVGRVSFTIDELGKMEGARAITHNHPSGSSLSPADIHLASNRGVREIRAVGKEYYYFAKPLKSKPWPSTDDISAELKIVEGEIRSDLMSQVIAGKITPEWASMNHYHLVWEIVSARVGFIYNRVKL